MEPQTRLVLTVYTQIEDKLKLEVFVGVVLVSS